MAVNLSMPDEGNLHPVPGVRLGVAEAGIRKANRKDLTVVLLDAGTSVAGVFTQNRFCAAPVQVCREHLLQGDIRAIVINTGNANAGTGEDGLLRARASCVALARELGILPRQVLPFSTGVIMEPLPLERIEAGLPGALADARPDNWLRAAQAIMTTDTLPKAFSRRGRDRGRSGDHHRHQQGRGHDPAEHGHHAGPAGLRRQGRTGRPAPARPRTGGGLVQPRHGGRGHLDQRLLRGDRDPTRRRTRPSRRCRARPARH